MKFLSSKREKQFNSVPLVQTSSFTKCSHPFSQISQYRPLSDVHMQLYSAIREAVPIIDAAILKTVKLIGGFEVACEDKEIEYLINYFLSNIQVGSTGQGVESFISSYLEQLLTYGTAIGEIIPNSTSTDVCALYNASLKDVELKISESPINLEIYMKDELGNLSLVNYPELILVSSLNPSPGSVYGTSILKGLPFVSEILLKIYNSIGLNWDRVGNVRFAVTYNPGLDPIAASCSKDRATQMASEWQKAMHNSNEVSDFIAVGDVNIKVIGADNQILDSNIPARQMLEQIVAKLSIPPFLLGLSWSSTERMSSQQADIMTSELETYRRLLTPVISKICLIWMKLNGCMCKYKINWNDINLQDEVESANARLLSAKAAEIEKKLQIQ